MSIPIHKSPLIFVLLVLFAGATTTFARRPHVINFRSPSLYPESVAWDPIGQHFIVGSLRGPTLLSVSDAAVVHTVVFDSSLPSGSVFVGVAVDSISSRLLAVVYSPAQSPPYSGLVAYDIRSGRRLFLADLPEPNSTIQAAGANDVAVDFSGNAYVTNSAGNSIWKVNSAGEPSVLSGSPAFKAHPISDLDAIYSACGLNGVAYVSMGYLLVVQSNTGKMFKVSEDDGTARMVLLNKDLLGADGIAVRSDGVVVVVSQHKAYFVKSDSSWIDGVVYDETALDAPRFATSVTVGAENRVYVLYGHLDEGLMGNKERESFSIVEIESEKESGDEMVWVFVLIGLGLAYFMFWRFQMGKLVANMNKKTA